MRGMSGTWAVTDGPRRMVGGRMAPAVARAETFQVVGDAELSDALTEAYAASRAQVNAQAGSYHLPQVPTTRAQAIMSYILLMRSAGTEDKRNAGHYRGRANEAAYKFANASIVNIAQTAYDLTKGSAPRTAKVALDILTQVKAGLVRTSAKLAKRRRRSGSSSAPTEDYDVPMEDVPPSTGMSWWPPSLPVAAGAAAVLVGAAYIFGGRR